MESSANLSDREADALTSLKSQLDEIRESIFGRVTKVQWVNSICGHHYCDWEDAFPPRKMMDGDLFIMAIEEQKFTRKLNEPLPTTRVQSRWRRDIGFYF